MFSLYPLQPKSWDTVYHLVSNVNIKKGGSGELLHAHSIDLCCAAYRFFSLVYFIKGEISRCTLHSVCMWIAWGGSCWFETACLSNSFTHDAWTVMQASGPQEKHTVAVPVFTSTAAFVLTIWRLSHLQVAPLFTVSISPRRPSVYAQWDYGKSRLGVQGNAVFLLRDCHRQGEGFINQSPW